MLIRTAVALLVAHGFMPDIAPSPVPRSGQALSPRASTSVSMTAETVRIALGEDDAQVVAVFTLENQSQEKEELEVGFPRSAQPAEASWSSATGLVVKRWGPSLIRDFSAKVDGEDVKAEPKLSPVKTEHMGWICWPMSFAGSQKRTVEVRYSVNTRDDNYSDPSPLLNRQVTYVLKTGAGWKGNIGEATIILDLQKISADNIARTAPEPTEKGKSSWTWTMRDFKPEADVLVQYRVYASAKEAVEKLEAKLKVNGAEVDAWINYADNLIAAEQPLKAAEAFVKLHTMEKQEGTYLFRGRTEYQPPAYRASKCYREAGKKDEAREWAKKAVAKLEEIAKKEHEFTIRKFLRTSREALAKLMQESRAWSEE